MKIKVSDTTNTQLDWLVAKANGNINSHGRVLSVAHWNPTEDWSQGGPIIEREGLTLCYQPQHKGAEWFATHPQHGSLIEATAPLVAAMRCYIASKLGEEVDVPEELK